jgi:hypothetical protein
MRHIEVFICIKIGNRSLRKKQNKIQRLMQIAVRRCPERWTEYGKQTSRAKETGGDRQKINFY